MKKTMACLGIVLGASFALADGIQSGDRVAIGDETYVVFHEAEWADFTNRVTRIETIAEGRWNAAHKHEEGRVAMHGRRTRTVETNGTITAVYADGYQFSERPKKKAHAKTAPNAAAKTARRKTEMSDADLWERIKERRRQALASTNEVSQIITR